MAEPHQSSLVGRRDLSPSPCRPSRPLLHDLAQALLAYSPAPLGAILEGFLLFFRASGPRGLPAVVGFIERGCRARWPPRGGPPGGGFAATSGLLHRQFDAASRPPALHVARLRRVPFAPTWTQSASAVGQAAGLFAKGGVDGRLVCLRRHLRLDPRHGPRTHAERPGDLVLSHAALGDGLAYGLFRLLIGPRPAQSLITLFRA